MRKIVQISVACVCECVPSIENTIVYFVHCTFLFSAFFYVDQMFRLIESRHVRGH